MLYIVANNIFYNCFTETATLVKEDLEVVTHICLFIPGEVTVLNEEAFTVV